MKYIGRVLFSFTAIFWLNGWIKFFNQSIFFYCEIKNWCNWSAIFIRFVRKFEFIENFKLQNTWFFFFYQENYHSKVWNILRSLSMNAVIIRRLYFPLFKYTRMKNYEDKLIFVFSRNIFLIFLMIFNFFLPCHLLILFIMASHNTFR